MSGRTGWIRVACAVVLAAGLAAPAFAGMPEAAKEDRSGYTDGVLRKLGRGIANIATCPLELPRTIQFVGLREGWGSGLTVGTLQGLWRTLLRAGAGVYEVVTFPAEVPKDFAPLMKPEFIFATETWTADPQ